MKKKNFTYGDFLDQLKNMEKFKENESLKAKIPQNIFSSKQYKESISKIEEVILAMTDEERTGLKEIEKERIEEIAEKSSSTIKEIDHFLKTFKRMKFLLKSKSFF